jgi:hypothetical protein
MAASSEVREYRPSPPPQRSDRGVGQQAYADPYGSLYLRGTRSGAQRVTLAIAQLCQANIDQRVGWNTGVVTNTVDPFDSPEQVVIWKAVNCEDSLARWPIIAKLFGTPMRQSRESVRPVTNIVVLVQVWCSGT